MKVGLAIHEEVSKIYSLLRGKTIHNLFLGFFDKINLSLITAVRYWFPSLLASIVGILNRLAYLISGNMS